MGQKWGRPGPQMSPKVAKKGQKVAKKGQKVTFLGDSFDAGKWGKDKKERKKHEKNTKKRCFFGNLEMAIFKKFIFCHFELFDAS